MDKSKTHKTLSDRFKSWVDYNICWSRSAAFVSVLVFGHKVVRNTIQTILITYLIDYPNNYHLVKAARFVNIMVGVTASLVIVVAYMSDALFSHLNIIIFSVLSTITGLLLFSLNLSLWGNYDSLYIIGILLLAVGDAGLRPLLKDFLADQLRGHGREARVEEEEQDRVARAEAARVEEEEPDCVEDEGRIQARKKVWWIVAWVCNVVATFVISNYSWETIFISSTSVLAGSFIVFLFGITGFVGGGGGGGSKLFNFFPVLKASLLKWHLHYPSSPDLFYQNHENQTPLSPQVKFFRWLDKAAIMEPSSKLTPEQQVRAGRLCTVTEVEESKFLLKMIPMWTSFLVIGLVASTGDTFSSEQGKNLDSTDFTFYIVIFIKPISQAATSVLFNRLPTSKRASEAQLKQGKIMRIWFGMVLCTIFSVVAWRVEVHRLQIVRLKRDNPDDDNIKNMSIFWLAPQYCLLGLMQGFGTDGLDEFMTGELPESLKNYVWAMDGFVVDGIGSLLSLLYVNANRKLFSTTMNDSRLDMYYLRLLILSFLNMCYYYPISILYRPIRYAQADVVERDPWRGI